MWLRIVKRNRAGEELYTAYTSRDGSTGCAAARGRTSLGNNARIGLLSYGWLRASWPSSTT